MNFLFASDSFKGSLSSEKINELLTVSAKKVFPSCTCKGVLMADGGEGTLEAVISQTKGNYREIIVKNPLFKDITAKYGYINARTAIITMSEASGLTLLSDSERNPLLTTSYGTGQLIADALDNNCGDITVTIGGSATNDGGMGAMTALGIRFLDSQGNELNGIGENLEKVSDIDMSGLHRSAKTAKFTVMCDVTNTLIGENGATYTFGEQKGADSETLKRLENGMTSFAAAVKRILGVDIAEIEGGGAAGGLGAALAVFLNAELKSGIETMLDLVGFDALIKDTDIVITGEGRIDYQSASGKVISGVVKRCMAANVPVVALVGGIGKDAHTLYQYGLNSIFTTVDAPMPLQDALANAEPLYKSAAERLFRLIKTGWDIAQK